MVLDLENLIRRAEMTMRLIRPTSPDNIQDFEMIYQDIFAFSSPVVVNKSHSHPDQYKNVDCSNINTIASN